MKRILVEAGAGCGKTTSIIAKFLTALKSKKEGGEAYLPESCLLLTFTDAAAREMRVRIREKAPDLRLDSTYVGTFHAYCLHLLSSARLIDSQAQILSDEELLLIIKDEFIQKVSSQKKLEELLSYINLKEVLNLVLWGSDNQQSVNAKIEEDFKEITQVWQDFKKNLERSLNSLDLEDLDATDWPVQALKLLEKDLEANIRLSQKKVLKEIVKKNPSLLTRVKQLRSLQDKEIYTPLLELFEKEQKVFSFLAEELREIRSHIPKYLTFTEIERRCLQGLREGVIKAPALSLIIVDEFQDTSPEQWEIIERISNAESDWYLVGDPKQSIYAFRKADIRLYKKLKNQLELLELSTNYRSAAPVLAATNQLQGNFFSDPLDPTPQSLQAGREYHNVAQPVVISEFTEWQSTFLRDRILQRHAENPDKKHAVLFREWKKLYAFAEELLTWKIPFLIQGSENHLDHFLTYAFVESLRTEAEAAPELDYLASFYKYCAQTQPPRWPQGSEWSAAMERLLVDFSAKEVRDWRKVAALLLSGKVPNLHIQAPLKELDHSLQLTLLTIHGSKGLEYDFVYLPDPRERVSFKDGFEEDEIPFKYSVGPQLKSRSLYHELQKIERTFKLESEQKRLFYVAITRAKLGLDFFIPRESSSTRADDTPWWGIWRNEESLKRFKWSQAIRSLDPQLAHFQELKSEAVNANDSALVFKPRGNAAPPSSIVKAPPPVQKRSPFQAWGDLLHGLLENWNGSAEQLGQLLANVDEEFRSEVEQTLQAMRQSPDLAFYWEALGNPQSEWMVLREEALIEQKTDEESFRYADVLMLRPGEAIILDWKSSLREELLSDPERIAKIKAQLEVYAKALRPKVPQVSTIAIGIFRDQRSAKRIL